MNGEEVDRILDDALASYSLQEPRTGLPARVMARVRSEGATPRTLWYLVAAAVLACVALAMVTWRSETHPRAVAWVPPTAEKIVERQPPVPPPSDVSRRVERPRSTGPLPRRESLPSPSALTPEEHTLIAVAQQAPETVRWLAQPDKPLEIEPIDIRPLQIDGLQTGENK